MGRGAAVPTNPKERKSEVVVRANTHPAPARPAGPNRERVDQATIGPNRATEDRATPFILPQDFLVFAPYELNPRRWRAGSGRRYRDPSSEQGGGRFLSGAGTLTRKTCCTRGGAIPHPPRASAATKAVLEGALLLPARMAQGGVGQTAGKKKRPAKANLPLPAS